jgi:hypothetical protein
VRLTVVASQGEADVICSLLRAHGVNCGDRPIEPSLIVGGGSWREVFVSEEDLDAARELLASTSPAD